MTPPTHIKLNNGLKIPTIGLGTWQCTLIFVYKEYLVLKNRLAPPGQVAAAVEHALKNGYRHLDCAWIYGNEAEVGQGIKASGVPREQLFITSKVWTTYMGRVEESLQMTLNALGTDYLDLYLIHWPVALNPNGNDPKFPKHPDGSRDVLLDWDLSETWRQMEEIYASGRVKAIGVSNWSEPNLQLLEKTWTVVPAVNQVELHPYLPQHDLKKYCESKGIYLEAYSPLGSTTSPLLKDSVILRIAEKHSVSVANVLISWAVNRGTVVLPKSVTPSRITENNKVIELDSEDMTQLDGLAASGKEQRLNRVPWGVSLKFADGF
ncbi:hypothetical protein FRC03_001375 [Tulasnella sp. 419]|nr:hypothetical protein FRC03_001375 [Tulasnella sp. 419]